jgi:hypothetical protein
MNFLIRRHRAAQAGTTGTTTTDTTGGGGGGAGTTVSTTTETPQPPAAPQAPAVNQPVTTAGDMGTAGISPGVSGPGGQYMMGQDRNGNPIYSRDGGRTWIDSTTQRAAASGPLGEPSAIGNIGGAPAVAPESQRVADNNPYRIPYIEQLQNALQGAGGPAGGPFPGGPTSSLAGSGGPTPSLPGPGGQYLMGQDQGGRAIYSRDGGRTWIDSDSGRQAASGPLGEPSVIGNLAGSAAGAPSPAAAAPAPARSDYWKGATEVPVPEPWKKGSANRAMEDVDTTPVSPDTLWNLPEDYSDQIAPFAYGGFAEDAPPVPKRKKAFASQAEEEEAPVKKGKGGIIRRRPAGMDEEEVEPKARRYAGEEDEDEDYEDAGDEEDSTPVRRARKNGEEAMARGGKLGLKPPKGVAVKPVFAVSILLGKKMKPGAEKKQAKGGRVPMPPIAPKPQRLAKGGRVADPHLNGGVNTNGRRLSNANGNGCANNNAARLGPGGGCANNNAAHLGPGGGWRPSPTRPAKGKRKAL